MRGPPGGGGWGKGGGEKSPFTRGRRNIGGGKDGVVATSVQAQTSGLTAAGSNFTGPGGGGGGATGSVGAFLPASSGSYTWGGANGGPRYGVAAGFANATGPAAVTVGSITVT